MKISKFIAAMAASAVSVSALAAMSLSANAEKKDSYTFYLAGQGGGTGGFWDPDTRNNTVTVDKNGSYTITLDAKDMGESGNGDLCMFIQTDVNIYDFAEGDTAADVISKSGITFTVDSIKIDGTAVKYTPSSTNLNVDNAGTALRLNIYNTWQDPHTEDIEVPITAGESIEVKFTVDGLFETTADDTTSDTTTTTTTTAAGNDTTAATTTTAASAGSSSSGSTETAAPTGDMGVGLAVSALAIAAGAAFIARKKD